MARNDQQDQQEDKTPRTTITHNGGSVTFGGSIVTGNQVGHTGGEHHGDIVMGSDDPQR